MDTPRLILLCAIFTSVTLEAAPEVRVDQPAGTNLAAGAVVYFGGMQERYVDPTSTTKVGNIFTATFTGITNSPFSTYQIQQSSNAESNWAQLFAPGLQPTPAGVIQFEDPVERVNSFYRLRILTDTRRVFTIKNNGTTELSNIGVAVAGTNAAHFELDLADTAVTLPSGTSTTFGVTYAADDTNARTSQLNITGNVPTFTLTLSSGDQPPPLPTPLLSNVTFITSAAGAPARIAGAVTGGPANGTVLLEASSDLGQVDSWAVISTIVLNATGSASFGTPTPVTDPGSVGSPRNFYRARNQ